MSFFKFFNNKSTKQNAPEQSTLQNRGWFDTIPQEVRKIVMKQIDIGSWLKFMQCSPQTLHESYQLCLPILEKYGFSLKLKQEKTVCYLDIKCDTDSRYGKMNCYEGKIIFTKKSKNSTEVHITRLRFPHSLNDKKPLMEFKRSVLCWNERKNMEDLVLQFFASYLSSYGKRINTLDIDVDSVIGEGISKQLVEFQPFDNFCLKIKLDGPNINFDQFVKLKGKEIMCTTKNWSTNEVTKLLNHLKGEVAPELYCCDINGTFDYDEEIERYCKQESLFPFKCQESASVIYSFYTGEYYTKIILNPNKCHFDLSWRKGFG